MNWHFPTHPSLLHISTNFYSNFWRQFFLPGRWFYSLIKCIQYTLLLIENYSQLIFDNLRQSSTANDIIRHAHCIHGYIYPKDVGWCRIVKLNVRLCFPLFYSSNNYIPLIQKLKQESFDKFMQNSHKYYIILNLKCQEFFIDKL